MPSDPPRLASDPPRLAIDPLSLGRSVVVGPGSKPPAPWAACERRVVAAIDAATADELQQAWQERRSLVIELHPGLGLDDPAAPPSEAIAGLEPWEWSVDCDLVGERLHHGLWANSVDARQGAGAASWHWRWAELAVELGATCVDRSGGVPGDDAVGGEVVLADGRPVICDGGPLDAGLAARIGCAVLHRIAIEHGSLRPLGPNDPARVALALDQLAAVTEPGASARVIAPAGSGKTRVLTERARLILKRWELPPAAVCLVAFNVRAAAEMRARLADLPGVRIRTLNALGLRLCGATTTIDEPEVRRILGELVVVPRRAESDPVAPYLEALGRVRLGLLAPEQVESEMADVSDLGRVARGYRAALKARGVVDFDEQVTGAIERLLADPQFRLRSQRFARVLLVDEFQDLTPAHLLLLRLLAGPAGGVFGVGDDDQTIYGYAGATPRFLVDFADFFPGAALHALEVNYRCPAPVVAAASNLLTSNTLRVPKQIRAARTAGVAAETAETAGVAAGKAETAVARGALEILPASAQPARAAAERVTSLLGDGADACDVAVLCRVNASLAPVQVLLRHHGIAVNGGVDRRFLGRGGVRAALSWLAVASAPERAIPATVLREAARRPKRGMSPSLLDLVAKQRSVEALASLAGWLESKSSGADADKVGAFADDVRALRARASGATTAEVLSVVRSEIGRGGLDASAAALDGWSHGAIASHLDDLAALAELADLEPDPGRFAAWLSDELSAPGSETGVTLASIHAVKGREWPHVVLHHVTEGLLPHRLADDLEEERRVLHVGLTRGRESVTVVVGEEASTFLGELDRPRRRSSHERAERASSRRTTSSPRRRSAEPERSPAALQPAPQAMERLRAWRSVHARAAGKPAYTIFDDATLELLATALPESEPELLAVRGIGPVKLQRYGDELIALSAELRSAVVDNDPVSPRGGR